MNHVQVSSPSRTGARVRWLTLAMASMTLVGVSGCLSKQPPDCESAEVLDTLKSVVINNAQQTLLGTPGKDSSGQFTMGSAYFYRNMTLAVSGVFDSGVNKDTKVRNCSANMRLGVPLNPKTFFMTAAMFGANTSGMQADAEGGINTKVDYEVRLDDKGEQFRVQSNSLNPLISLVSAGHGIVSSKLQWSGQWAGSYQCDQGATSQVIRPEIANAHAPFKLAINEYVLSGNLPIERTTTGGGFEKITVRFGQETIVTIHGANTPDDRWVGDLRGEFKDDRLALKGDIRVQNNSSEIISKCTMNLEFTPIAEQHIAEALSD